MALAPPAPISLPQRLRLVSDLLIFGIIPFHWAKSEYKLVNVGRMQTKSISNNALAASGCTYDCGSAAAMALAPPGPIVLISRLRLANTLLIFGISGSMRRKVNVSW